MPTSANIQQTFTLLKVIFDQIPEIHWSLRTTAKSWHFEFGAMRKLESQAVQQYANLVDLEKHVAQKNLWLQNLISIQPRTGAVKVVVWLGLASPDFGSFRFFLRNISGWCDRKRMKEVRLPASTKDPGASSFRRSAVGQTAASPGGRKASSAAERNA